MINLDFRTHYKYDREKYISYPYDTHQREISIAYVQLIEIHHNPCNIVGGRMQTMQPAITYYRFKVIKKINYHERDEFELSEGEVEAYISEIPKYINTIQDLYER